MRGAWTNHGGIESLPPLLHPRGLHGVSSPSVQAAILHSSNTNTTFSSMFCVSNNSWKRCLRIGGGGGGYQMKSSLGWSPSLPLFSFSYLISFFQAFLSFFSLCLLSFHPPSFPPVLSFLPLAISLNFPFFDNYSLKPIQQS